MVPPIDRSRPARIETFTGFTLAEDHHRKHALQRFPELLEELRSVYPTVPELIGSTAVTRIMGMLPVWGTARRC